MLESIVGDAPMDNFLVFRDLKGKSAVITTLFPPLDEGVDKVDFISISNPEIDYPSNSVNTSSYNLKVYDSVEELPYKII